MRFLSNILKGNYSIHYLAIGWYLSTTVVSFAFEKFPSTTQTSRIETVLYLIATSSALQTLISVFILTGLFRIQKNDLTKVGVLYITVITVMLSLNVVTLYEVLGHIYHGDCNISYWCMRTFFDK